MASSPNTSSSASSGPSRKYIPPALRSQQASSPSRPTQSGPSGSGSRGTSEPPWPTASASYQQPSRRVPTSNLETQSYQRNNDTQRNGGRYPQPTSSMPYDYSNEDDQHARAQRHPEMNSAPSSRTAYIPPSQRLGRIPPTTPLSHSAPSPRRRYIPESATLFLAGDSFVGALSPAKGPQPKEMPNERGESEVEKEEYGVLKREWEVYDAIPKMIKIRKEKGAAAKGLNNPRSKKNIAPKVLDHGISAFGDMYHDYNKTPRFFMMMFGNVDLNINYLWQLVNREITPASFTPEELASAQNPSDFSILKKQREADLASADHTENDNTPTALGPTLFVTKVIREYTQFIEREIINGPIGAKLKGFDEAANDIHARNMQPSRNRVLVAGALPPMVRDENLYRILGKYVDQHVEAISMSPAKVDLKLESIGKRRGSRSVSVSVPERGDSNLVDVGPPSATDSIRSSVSNTSEVDHLADSINTNLTIPDTISESGTSAEQEKEREIEAESKSTFQTLLTLDPSPCTLPIRSQMINSFNSQLSTFCAKYPSILKYISINDQMSTSHPGDISILDYYSSQVEGDGANVHPTWERTYPLWLDQLRGVGVDVDSFPEVDLEGSEAAWTAEKGARLEGSRYKT